LQSTDTTAFEAAVLPHLDAAYTLARYLLRDDADAEDAVQEAVLRALRYFAGFRGVEGRAWLLRIVRNTCFTWRRRRGAEPTVPLDDELHGGADGGVESPEDALILAAGRDLLHAAIDRLPAEFREVIVLRELEGLSYLEIAEVAGVPVGTVMSRLSRARRRLQLALHAHAPEAR
jgi:RNA polymerase sigma-70 factor (ECF subfamily)